MTMLGRSFSNALARRSTDDGNGPNNGGEPIEQQQQQERKQKVRRNPLARFRRKSSSESSFSEEGGECPPSEVEFTQPTTSTPDANSTGNENAAVSSLSEERRFSATRISIATVHENGANETAIATCNESQTNLPSSNLTKETSDSNDILDDCRTIAGTVGKDETQPTTTPERATGDKGKTDMSPSSLHVIDETGTVVTMDTTEDDVFESGEVNEQASGHCKAAIAFAKTGSHAHALEQVELGLQVSRKAEKEYWDLLLVKAEVLGREGKIEDSLNVYKTVLDHTLMDGTTIKRLDEIANLYYACGKMSAYLGLYHEAIEYYMAELLCTIDMFGPESSPVARVHHELARLYRQGLGDQEKALEHYKRAAKVELEIYRGLRKEAENAGWCEEFKSIVREAAQQVEDTRKCMGRIYFELGDINRAMHLSVDRGRIYS